MSIGTIFGTVLFIFGVVLMGIAFLATVGRTDIISGFTIVGFTLFGFILCITGYVMAISPWVNEQVRKLTRRG